METWAFLGGFLAVALGITAIILVARRKIRNFSRNIFGSGFSANDIVRVFSELETDVQETPRSLSGCDSLLMPQILADFPDFDITLAKTYVRDYLKENLGSHEEFTIYNVAIAKYLSSGVQRTIVFQAAVSWKEEGTRTQKRYDLHYTHLLSSTAMSVAANCPNCGGILGYGETECSFCNSRVANVLGNSWEFTELRES